MIHINTFTLLDPSLKTKKDGEKEHVLEGKKGGGIKDGEKKDRGKKDGGKRGGKERWRKERGGESSYYVSIIIWKSRVKNELPDIVRFSTTIYSYDPRSFSILPLLSHHPLR